MSRMNLPAEMHISFFLAVVIVDLGISANVVVDTVSFSDIFGFVVTVYSCCY
jgi:hypothetical protein